LKGFDTGVEVQSGCFEELGPAVSAEREVVEEVGFLGL